MPRTTSRNRISNAVQRPLRAPLGSIVQFRQPAWTTTFSQTAGAAAFSAGNFTLSQATNYTGFTDIWDVYRVDYLEFTFRPLMVFTASAPTVTIAPALYVVIDKDDAAVPSTIATLREYSSCRTTVYDPMTVRFRPGILSYVYTGSTTSPSGHEEGRWLDCAATNIPHYGIKFGCDAGAAGQTLLQTWSIDLYVGLSFKYVR